MPGRRRRQTFLRDLNRAVPYRIHSVLTDNGVQFTACKQDIWNIQHIFDLGPRGAPESLALRNLSQPNR
jgi:hypothetical protein